MPESHSDYPIPPPGALPTYDPNTGVTTPAKPQPKPKKTPSVGPGIYGTPSKPQVAEYEKSQAAQQPARDQAEAQRQADAARQAQLREIEAEAGQRLINYYYNEELRRNYILLRRNPTDKTVNEVQDTVGIRKSDWDALPEKYQRIAKEQGVDAMNREIENDNSREAGRAASERYTAAYKETLARDQANI